ncbi:acyltransferase domain-containing protein [Streptomyces sp. NPDC014894]|uniref:acyltransferase domain-containing protein n=1 Tax=Streptomyces sp. NPDC014894 TaxID=3364931 RepID=UPI0036FE66C0
MTDTRAELPETDALAEELVDLAAPHEDITELLALRRRMATDPGLRRELESAVGGLVEDMGVIDGGAEPPAFAEPGGSAAAVDRYLPVYVFLAALPHVRAFHRERSVPADVSRRTLADLGRQMALHRAAHGAGGLPAPWWLRLHFRGELYQLGRLQFQRSRLGDAPGAAVRSAGLPHGPGDPVLELHIPDFLGPLTPEACDRSLARAGAFFARSFPEEPYALAACDSWLLDSQLAGYLPAHSNIRSFQDRFRVLTDRTEIADKYPVQFVFGDPELPWDTLPRRTALERAVGDHLRAGGHWYGGRGWFPLPGSHLP